MPDWACEFDSHLGHRKTEVVDFQRSPLFLFRDVKIVVVSILNALPVLAIEGDIHLTCHLGFTIPHGIERLLQYLVQWPS